MANPQPEPSMEEILASIRRIISEDEEEELNAAAAPKTPPLRKQPAPGAEPSKSAPQAKTAATPTTPVAEEADKKDEKPAAPAAEQPEAALVNAEPEATAAEAATEEKPDNADAHLATEQVEMIKQSTAATPRDAFDESIVSDVSAAAATASFQALSHNLRVSAGEGHTLEDLVVEMLKPMVKEWLDANLPAIVERKVEDEVERIARRR